TETGVGMTGAAAESAKTGFATTEANSGGSRLTGTSRTGVFVRDFGDDFPDLGRLLREPGAVIMVGERTATVRGALSAATRLADDTGAALAWVPRRAGERGAIEAGALPTLLPGGRPVVDSLARQQVKDRWDVDELPALPGRDTAAILANAPTLGALVIGGVEVTDLPDPRAALAAIDATRFVVSLEQRRSEVTDRADVVFPVATAMEKAGTYLSWEGRPREFDAALADPTVRREAAQLADHRVLHAIADEMGIALGLPDIASARADLTALGIWDGPPAVTPVTAARELPQPPVGTAILAGWRMLLDRGRLQDGEPNLAATARTPVVRLSHDTAADIGASTGDPVRVGTDHGSITLPLEVTDMPDRVVWLPLNSPGSQVYEQLAVTPGHLVRIRREDHRE
uniref:molybdopterin dinucleotide binding domain-containing protein n=1 Tax=Nocardia alni TaxID=2815723 RepID=UPI001C21700E